MIPSLFIAVLFLISCATVNRPNIPVVWDDPKAQSLAIDEATKILSVTENAGKINVYDIRLVRFPRKNTMGMSAGNHEIYLNYELTQRATADPRALWLFRKTLAHEIAHDVAGHAPNQQAIATAFSAGSNIGRIVGSAPGVVGLAGTIAGLALAGVGAVSTSLYTRSAELEADKLALGYWKKLGWDCRIWVRIFEAQFRMGYQGDFHHPTDERLRQSLEVCLPASDPERQLIEKRVEDQNQKWLEQQKVREQQEREDRRE